MKYWPFFIVLSLPFPLVAQVLPNEEDFREIARMTSAAAHANNDQELIKSFERLAGPELCGEKPEIPKKTVMKERPELSFFFKVMAPSEDLKVTDLNMNPATYMDELRPVIMAQNDAERNTAIRNLCADKTNMEKIHLGSTLFNRLGQVYNFSMLDGGDAYSAQDPTKNASETKLITIQRQYNALNAKFYGASGYPDVAGVCRHASTLVSDFLSQCGFETKHIAQVSYRTADAGHATVKVVDPKTQKTYFLNWGEVKELESPDGLTSFDVPSDSIKSTGMLISLYTPDEKGKLIGKSRTHEGVVIARLLNVADDQIDLTVYQTTEAGTVLDLGTKSIKYNKSGNTKFVNQEIALKLIDAQNIDYFGENESIFGLGASYKRDAVKYFGDHIYWKNRMQTSVGVFDTEKSTMDQKGFGVTHIQGMSVGKYFKNNVSKTSAELGADIIGELYSFSSTDTDLEASKNTNHQFYMISSIKLNHQFGKNNFEVNASMRTTMEDSIQGNYENEKPKITVYNPQFSAIYSRELNQDKQVGVTGTYIGSIDRQFIKSDIFLNDEKNKLNVSTGFMVVKTVEGQDFVYSVSKIDKDFDLNKLDLNASVSAQKSVNTSSPVLIQATLRVTPKFRKPVSSN